MGNCFGWCQTVCPKDELEEVGGDSQGAAPVSVTQTSTVRSARRYGSTISSKSNKSTEQERKPLLNESARGTMDETSEGVGKKNKKSTLKKLKHRLTGKKSTSREGSHNDYGSGHSSNEETKQDLTLSTAEATRAAMRATAERGDKLQGTEERMSKLALHAKGLSETSKLVAEKKKKKSKKSKP